MSSVSSRVLFLLQLTWLDLLEDSEALEALEQHGRVVRGRERGGGRKEGSWG